MTSKPSSPGLTTRHERIHIGAVHVHQAAGVVHGVDDFEDGRFEEAECAGHGDHHAGDAVAQLALAGGVQRVGYRRCPASSAGSSQHFHAGHGDGGRVGAVGAVGHEDDIALAFAAVDVILADHQDACELALSAGGRRQTDGLEAADLAEPVLQLVHQEERALGAGSRQSADAAVRIRAGGRRLR